MRIAMTENVKDLIRKAEEFTKQEKFEEAIKILEILFSNHPKSSHIRKNLVDSLFAYGGYLNDEFTLQYKKAQEIFKKIIKIDPANYRAHYNLGIAHFNLENMKQAKECYEEAIKIKPDYKHCFYNLGLIFEQEGNFPEALKYYERALEIDSNFPYANNARNHILSNLDELNKSKAMTTKLPNLDKVKSLLGMSKRIKIDMIQSLLNLEREKLIDLIIEWGQKYDFKIDGDYLIINKESLPNLLKSLENQK